MLTIKALLFGAVVANAELYCPTANDMNNESPTANITFVDGGWTIVGDGRVSSKTSFNLLGGFMEFDMDTSRVANEVNTNFYTSSPAQANCGASCYCDIQKSNSGKPSCMEMDIIENNGQCAMATTIHTFATDGQPNNQNCDRWGCGSSMTLPSPKFKIRAEFGLDGSLTVYLNGVKNNNYGPSPSADSNSVVIKTMESIGACIESSQWFGWAPAESSCPSGDRSGLDASVVSISNVRVNGTIVQGPTPSKCASTPTPAPPAPSSPTPAPPTPSPPPAPTPGSKSKTCADCSGGACDCSWVTSGSCNGSGDGSCCFNCCCNK